MDLKKLFSKIPTLYTERLTIREITVHDAEGVLRVFSDPEVTRFNFRNYLANVRESRLRIQYWKTCYSAHQRIYWGIFFNEIFIGNIGVVQFDLRGDRLEIGYNLSRSYWGKGYMKEALAAVLSHLYEEIGANRVDALVLPQNDNSIRLLKSLNFTQDGILRGAAKTREEDYEDVILYGLLRKDFTNPSLPPTM
jgi:ribosomal-protein-alanine N-acetyltransferase